MAVKTFNSFCLFCVLLCFFLFCLERGCLMEEVFVKRSRRFTPKEVGPISEHGKLCKSPWRPNLLDPLEKCHSTKNCTENGFECMEGGNCCPTKEVVCLSTEDSGRERMQDEHFGRYAYSAQLKTCVKFSYFGNEGNFNNFLKHSECMHYCHSPAN